MIEQIKWSHTRSHSYDYRPNWTSLSPITIIYTCILGIHIWLQTKLDFTQSNYHYIHLNFRNTLMHSFIINLRSGSIFIHFVNNIPAAKAKQKEKTKILAVAIRENVWEPLKYWTWSQVIHNLLHKSSIQTYFKAKCICPLTYSTPSELIPSKA